MQCSCGSHTSDHEVVRNKQLAGRFAQQSGCSSVWSEFLVWNQDVGGSNPSTQTKYAGVGKMAKPPVLETGYCRFESCRRYQFYV